MPNINIDDGYVLGETGAQVDKVTGLFTKDENTNAGEKAFAQLNIGTAGSNRNLLDNPWFTVRQRGDGAFSGAVYTVDRWKIAGGNVVVTPRTPYGVNLHWTTACAYDQYFDIDPQILVGKTVTLSAMVDGVVYSQSAVYSSSGAYVITITVGNVLFRLGYFSSTGRVFVRIGNAVANVETDVNVDAIKLELGSVSTLANDAPPNYWDEYRKCRRYFKRLAPWQSGLLAVGRTDNATTANFVIGDEPMAKQTGITATITGSINVRAGDNTNHAVTSINVGTTEGGGIVLVCATTGLTAFASAALVLGSGGQIDISADL